MGFRSQDGKFRDLEPVLSKQRNRDYGFEYGLNVVGAFGLAARNRSARVRSRNATSDVMQASLLDANPPERTCRLARVNSSVCV
jgi:hypothetical protein